MAKKDGQTIIKKYANRRLYNTGTSTYVTLDDLAVMVKDGEDFIVVDAKSGEDITHSVLTQIIFEQESKTGNTLLPISFLRQLISFYGDQVQMLVPSYLEQSMTAFTSQQEQMREQISKAFGETPMGRNMQVPMQLMEEQVRRNTEMFQQAMQMFTPFAGAGASQEEDKAESAENKDLKELKDQLRALQNKLDSMDRLIPIAIQIELDALGQPDRPPHRPRRALRCQHRNEHPSRGPFCHRQSLVEALLRLDDHHAAQEGPVTPTKPLHGTRQALDRLVLRRREEQCLGKGPWREVGIAQETGELVARIRSARTKGRVLKPGPDTATVGHDNDQSAAQGASTRQASINVSRGFSTYSRACTIRMRSSAASGKGSSSSNTSAVAEAS